jgi:hypothetical protein
MQRMIGRVLFVTGCVWLAVVVALVPLNWLGILYFGGWSELLNSGPELWVFVGVLLGVGLIALGEKLGGD